MAKKAEKKSRWTRSPGKSVELNCRVSQETYDRVMEYADEHRISKRDITELALRAFFEYVRQHGDPLKFQFPEDLFPSGDDHQE